MNQESEPKADGPELVRLLTDLTGLDEKDVRSEITTILAANDASIDHVTLDQLRQAMITYLEAVKDRVDIQLAGSELN